MIALLYGLLVWVVITILHLLCSIDDSPYMVGGAPGLEKVDKAEERWEHVHRLLEALGIDVEGKRLQPIWRYSQLSEVSYVSNLGVVWSGCHHGQRKLLNTEIQFLTNCAAHNGANKPLVIYAGSAPNEKLPMLLEMFPLVKFLLIDPNYHHFDADFRLVYQRPDLVAPSIMKASRRMAKPLKKGASMEARRHYANARRLRAAPLYGRPDADPVNMHNIEDPVHVSLMNDIRKTFEHTGHRALITDILEGDDRVYVIQDYLTKQLVDLLAASRQAAGAIDDILFISDIRSSVINNQVTDIDYMWNDALHLMVIKILSPSYSMLKFHPPYMTDYSHIRAFIDDGAGVWPPLVASMKEDLEFVHKEYGLDLLGNYMSRTNEYKYLSADMIWLQSWGPGRSSEARLIVSRSDAAKGWRTYSHATWDNKFYWLGLVRGIGYFPKFYEIIKDHPKASALWDGSFEAMLDIFILGNYLWRQGGGVNGVDMNVDIVAQGLAAKGGIDKIVTLRSQIDKFMIYPIIHKCPYYEQVTEAPIECKLYVHGKGRDQGVMACYLRNGRLVREPMGAAPKGYPLAANFVDRRPDANRKLMDRLRKRWMRAKGYKK